MAAFEAGTRRARVRAWPRAVRWLLVGLAFALTFGAILLVLQPGAWVKILGLMLLCVAMPAMIYSKRWLGLCRGSEDGMRPVERRYTREMALPLTAYMLIVLTLLPLAKKVDSVPLKVVLALAPVVPIAFMVRAIVRYVTGSDELEQRMHLQALAVSAGVVGMGSITAGFLAATGVLDVDGGVLLWVLPALLIVYGLTRAWVARRYRDE